MASNAAQATPATLARVAGLLYLVLFVSGPFSILYVPATVTVAGDAVATAANIQASEGLFRLGILGYCAIFLADLTLAAVFYRLLKPVSPTLSLVAAFARLAQAIMHGTNLLYLFIALVLVSGAGYLTVFESGQVAAIVLALLEGHGQGVLVGQVFFGFHCVVLGYLLFRSDLFPAVLGLLMALAGVSYLIDSLGRFLFPAYGGMGANIVILPAIVGEVALLGWLLARGVRTPARGYRATH